MKTAETVTLTAMDRCDRCNAAAKVVATFMNGQLMFCGHHARKYDELLQNSALTLAAAEDHEG